MNVMNHQGYIAQIEYSNDDNCFIGKVPGNKDIPSFRGESVSGLKKAFKEAVATYMRACEKAKREPKQSYSGKFMLRVEPALHAQIAMAAKKQKKSLNGWICEALAKAAKSK